MSEIDTYTAELFSPQLKQFDFRRAQESHAWCPFPFQANASADIERGVAFLITPHFVALAVFGAGHYRAPQGQAHLPAVRVAA